MRNTLEIALVVGSSTAANAEKGTTKVVTAATANFRRNTADHDSTGGAPTNMNITNNNTCIISTEDERVNRYGNRTGKWTRIVTLL